MRKEPRRAHRVTRFGRPFFNFRESFEGNMLQIVKPHADILHEEFDDVAEIDKMMMNMKHLSHLHRMNPQTARTPRRVPRLSTILTALFISALAALYWIGKFYSH